MSDSYLDIGGEPVFPFTPNWASLPKGSLGLARIYQQFKGGPTNIATLVNGTPITFDANFMLETKAKQYTLIEFLHNALGRSKRFWIEYPKMMFTLLSDASVGATGLIVRLNNFSLAFQGYERIYILMNDGDIVTRWVTSISVDNENDNYILHLNTALDRAVTLENYTMIGRFLLVRFDQDEFDFSLFTDKTQEIDLRFYELIREYEEMEAD